MTPPPAPTPLLKLSRGLQWLCGLYAFFYLCLYIHIAAQRILYPFELEWMEGGMVDHVRWILAGHKLYAEPSLEFTAFIYPPLYFYVSAAVAMLTNISFFPLRIVSFLSSIATFSLLFFWVKKETRRPFYGLLSAGLYASTFPLSGFWFDIGRVDSLFLALLLSCLFCIRFGRNLPSIFLASFLFLLTWLTKQTALILAFPIACYLFFTHAKRCFFFILSAAFLTLSVYSFLNQYFDGWFHYYLFDIPKAHALYPNLLTVFWIADLWNPLAVSCALSLLFLLVLLFKKNKTRALFYILITSSLLTIACASRIHSQAYSNVLFPSYAAISLLTPMGLHLLMRHRKRISGQVIGPLLGSVLVLLQFSQLSYSASATIPSRNSQQQGEALIAWMKSVPGDILVPYHGQLSAMAGKSSSAHAMATFDIIRSPDHSGAKIIHEYQTAVSEKNYTAIILDEWESFLLFPKELAGFYEKPLKIFGDRHGFYPITGSSFKPYKVAFRKDLPISFKTPAEPVIPRRPHSENRPH